ncbi:MAG: hypothetical protein LQ345_007227 [Seirophora villosa]|nr:MAG: hypothetical protein LQ345_007227 [Seirophora villosa]
MPSQAADPQGQPVESADPQPSFVETGQQRIRVLPGASDTAASFHPEVELCGYSIPHPSEAKMNLRIQTYDSTTVYDALERGLDNLMDLCDVVESNFTAARDGYEAQKET